MGSSSAHSTHLNFEGFWRDWGGNSKLHLPSFVETFFYFGGGGIPPKDAWNKYWALRLPFSTVLKAPMSPSDQLNQTIHFPYWRAVMSL